MRGEVERLLDSFEDSNTFMKNPSLPKPFDQSNMLFAPTVIALAIVFGIMAYAAYVSIGEAKIFGEKSLDF